MIQLIILTFWILSKVICFFTLSSSLFETGVVAGERQYLYVEVAVDSSDCNIDTQWELQQSIVYTVLQKNNDLGLSGAGRHCGCIHSPNNSVCEGERNKAVVNLLYESKNSIINADGNKLATLESQLTSKNIPSGVVKENVSSYFICANLKIITESNEDYKSCISHSESGDTSPVFANTTPNPNAGFSDSSGKPGTATIIGAAVGSLAGLGALLALIWAVYRHFQNGNQVNDSGTSSDVTPIVPGIFDGEAPNSVPPAGTG